MNSARREPHGLAAGSNVHLTEDGEEAVHSCFEDEYADDDEDDTSESLILLVLVLVLVLENQKWVHTLHCAGNCLGPNSCIFFGLGAAGSAAAAFDSAGFLAGSGAET